MYIYIYSYSVIYLNCTSIDLKTNTGNDVDDKNMFMDKYTYTYIDTYISIHIMYLNIYVLTCRQGGAAEGRRTRLHRGRGSKSPLLGPPKVASLKQGLWEAPRSLLFCVARKEFKGWKMGLGRFMLVFLFL